MIVRRPVCGKIEIAREYAGVEMGFYVPEDPAESPCWRILIPENPIPCSYVDLTCPGSDEPIRFLSRHYPDPPGGVEPFTSTPINGAGTRVLRECLDELRADRRPHPYRFFIQWADGTTYEGDYIPVWFKGDVTEDGLQLWNETADLRETIFRQLRDALGLSPTPARYLADGAIPAETARENYLDDVAHHPDLRDKAAHILSRCRI